MSPRLRRWVGGALLLVLQAPALPSDADNVLITTYVPQIVAAVASFNPAPLAVVDTLSYRKHVTGNDGIAPMPVPQQYSIYTFPGAPQTLDIPYPGGTTKTMTVQTHDGGGFTVVSSTGTRYLQFALLTIGLADSPGNPHAELTAQTWYRISNDGGQTFTDFKQIIASGTGYDAFHPLPGVTVGKNGYQFPGDTLIVTSNQGQDVLLPLAITPLDSNGNPIQPPFPVSSYMEAHILRGHWRSDGSDLDWELGQAAQVPMSESTRGLDETAVVELATNGHCEIVSRGSNQNAPPSNPPMAGHYWLFESQDGCRTWDGPGIPLGWDDGSIYYAPAAPPFLYKNGNDRVVFMGAHSDSNSNGNFPRTRVVAAELEINRLTLLKRSAVIVDEQSRFDTSNLDLIFGNNYYPQSSGNVFYYTIRFDSGYCLDPSQCTSTATALQGNPAFPHNWHLLNPIPTARKDFVISANPTTPSLITWPAVVNASKYLVYVRNDTYHTFWDLQGEVSAGSATSFPLQGVRGNNTVEVNVFAVAPDGTLSSSNQISTTFTSP